MNRDEARQEIRRNWRSIITHYTTRARQNVNGQESYICPFCGHGTHGDGMTYNPKSNGGHGLKCFGCDFSGDIIDFIQKAAGTDYAGALSAAADILHITIDADGGHDHTARRERPKTGPISADRLTEDKKPMNDGKSPQGGAQAAPLEDYTDFYERCAAEYQKSPAALTYMNRREISPETAAAYKIGFCPNWISPTIERKQRAKGDNWRPEPRPCIIIPVTSNFYISRDITADDQKKRYVNETGGGGTDIFNAAALDGAGPVFVVEGAIDALSILECGGQAVALNSTANKNILINRLQEHPTRATLILCLDNDDKGKSAAADLAAGLDRLRVKHILADICGGAKDPNEALTKDRGTFLQAIREAQEQAKAAGDPQPATITPDAARDPQPAPLPGLLTYSAAVELFKSADDRHINIKSFPDFSRTAKIKKHDSIVIAADTGAGKSSLALNFLHDLNQEYPCIYFNLEMDAITVLRRLVAIHTGVKLDIIEGYKHDEQTADIVNFALQELTAGKPLQIVQGVYNLEEIGGIIKASTASRTDPTIIIIDHSLLVDTEARSAGRYERFTQVSEGLRKIALRENIILFVLLQQNRAGKLAEAERPKNSSLKESGSWENDATQICFLWDDPAEKTKKLLLTKNRNGSGGEFPLSYWADTQTYKEQSGGEFEKLRAGERTPFDDPGAGKIGNGKPITARY